MISHYLHEIEVRLVRQKEQQPCKQELVAETLTLDQVSMMALLPVDQASQTDIRPAMSLA